VAHETFEPLGFAPWRDPHNDDPTYARVRVRRSMDQLNADLGPGIIESLARTAALLGDDADALESWARGEFERLVDVEEGACSADIAALEELPRAIRTRVIRLMHQCLVGRSDELFFDHIQQVEASISRWKGQGPTALPGRVSAHLACGRLCLAINEESDTRE
jgi:tRNA(Ile)-lysidine synthase TilS/MesJ